MPTGVAPETNVAVPAAASAPVLGGPASAAALALTMFVEAVGYGVVAPTLPFLARQAGAGEERIGFLVGLYAAVGLLASIPFGVLANRYGRRALILVGLACLTLASFGFIVAEAYPWLVVARFIQGLGATAIWVGSLTVAADLSTSGSMGKSLSIITGSWSLGFVVGPALGGIGTVRTPFVLYAALSGLALVAALFALPETGRLGTRTTLAGILRILKRPPVLASAAATLALSFYYGTVEAFLPLMVSAAGVDRVDIGLLFAVAAMPAVALPRLSGHLADRIGDVRLIVVGLLFGAALNASFLLIFGKAPGHGARRSDLSHRLPLLRLLRRLLPRPAHRRRPDPVRRLPAAVRDAGRGHDGRRRLRPAHASLRKTCGQHRQGLIFTRR